MAGKENGSKFNGEPIIWTSEECREYWRETTTKDPSIGSNPRFQGAIEEVAAEIEFARQKVSGNKAVAVEVLGFSLPKDIRINQRVFPPGQSAEISRAVHEAIDKGKDVGVRTSFLGKSGVSEMGKAPWIMGLPKEETNIFLGKPYARNPHWRGSKETLRQWIKGHPGLSEIIVMENPAGLGEKEFEKNHFVFRLDVSLNELRIELCLGTDQLRSLDESATRKSLIEIKAKIPQRAYGIFSLGETTVSPGGQYVQKKAIGRMKTERSFAWNEESAQAILKRKPYRVVKQIIEKVFKEWPHNGEERNFYYNIMALERLGYGMIEFQGRYDKNGNIQWILAYGLRGTAESSILKQKKTEYSGD
jgi:hypothetical protein